MRTLSVVTLVALLAACGGDDDDDGGGGGGGSNLTLTGPVSGTLTSGSSASVAGTCNPGTGTVGFAGAFVVVSTAANVCSEAIAGREVANSTTAFITVLKIAATGTSTALDAGTYPVDSPSVDGQGNIRFSFVDVTRTGTSAGAGLGCTVLAEPFGVSGSVTITSAGGGTVSGTVSATLDDGTTVSGSFSAPACGISLTVDPACDISGLPDPTTCSA